MCISVSALSVLILGGVRRRPKTEVVVCRSMEAKLEDAPITGLMHAKHFARPAIRSCRCWGPSSLTRPPLGISRVKPTLNPRLQGRTVGLRFTSG